MNVGDRLGKYIAILGGVTAGTFPLTFMIDGQPVGQTQQVNLQLGPPDLSRMVVEVQGLQSSPATVVAGSNITATVKWADRYRNVEPLDDFLQAGPSHCIVSHVL